VRGWIHSTGYSMMEDEKQLLLKSLYFHLLFNHRMQLNWSGSSTRWCVSKQSFTIQMFHCLRFWIVILLNDSPLNSYKPSVCTSNRFTVLQKPKWTPKLFHFFLLAPDLPTRKIPFQFTISSSSLSESVADRHPTVPKSPSSPSSPQHLSPQNTNTSSSGVRISVIVLMPRNT